MTTMQEVAMRLELKEGKTQLVIEETRVFTKAEAIALSMQIRRWSAGLPDHQPRKKAKGKSSRQTASRRPAKAKVANGDAAAATTAAA